MISTDATRIPLEFSAELMQSPISMKYKRRILVAAGGAVLLATLAICYAGLLARVRALLDVHVLGRRPHFLGPKIDIGPGAWRGGQVSLQ